MRVLIVDDEESFSRPLAQRLGLQHHPSHSALRIAEHQVHHLGRPAHVHTFDQAAPAAEEAPVDGAAADAVADASTGQG